MKKCTKCDVVKDLDSFSPSPRGKLGRHSHCNECKRKDKSTPEARAKQKAYREKNKEKQKKYMRNYHQVKTYGLTIVEKEYKLEEQGGRCAMCRTDKPGGTWDEFHTDHDHMTGDVRGLLCFSCNRNLGYYEMHKDKCEEYLDKYNG